MLRLLLISQMTHLNPILEQQASLRPLAARIRQEPQWENAQIILAGTRGHGLEFYLQRFVDVKRGDADIVLVPTPVIEHRLYETIDELHLRDSEKAPTLLITRERELERGTFLPAQWTQLAQEGAFVLLRHRHDYR